MNDIQINLKKLFAYLDRLIKISKAESNPELERQAKEAKEELKKQIKYFDVNIDEKEEIDLPLGKVLINVVKLLRKLNEQYQALNDTNNFINQNQRLFWKFQGYLNYSPDVDSSGETLFIP